ncbi:MAG: hypothetical protein WCO00_00145 [Rhodospirillaceae bacterium]
MAGRYNLSRKNGSPALGHWFPLGGPGDFMEMSGMAAVDTISGKEIHGTRVQKNLSISRALFNIIFESIDRELMICEVVTLDEVRRIEKKLNESWHHIESLFDNTCAQCMETQWYVRDERRKDAITRLVYARLIIGVPERSTEAGASFPRVIVPGLQTMIAIMLTAREWKVLNDFSRFIFDYIGSDHDEVLAKHYQMNTAVQMLVQRIMITLLLRFKGFNTRRNEFVRIINNAVRESNYRMSDIDFCATFETLFREYHDMVQSDDGCLKLSLYHAEDVPEKVRGIFDAYFRFKEGIVATRTMTVRARGR